MIERRVAQALAVLGGGGLVVAFGWWWLVFRTLVGNGSMSLMAALPCLTQNSDLCVLAQALCSSEHWFGIRHYDTLLFWCATGVIVASTLSILREHRVPTSSAPVSRYTDAFDRSSSNRK
jgi:hypothetical protein